LKEKIEDEIFQKEEQRRLNSNEMEMETSKITNDYDDSIDHTLTKDDKDKESTTTLNEIQKKDKRLDGGFWTNVQDFP